MKTEISRFCIACSESLFTLPTALDKAVAQFERRIPELQSPLAALNDIRARLRSLTEKLANQHTYLLIFGPLKSGKSTLMNAISGAYVSEVTSLPGYPCLVFVRNSAKARHSVTSYNGKETIYPDGAALSNVVIGAHLALAGQIRAAEERGETFDPGTNYPEAIRRIDIRLPVPALEDSGTVLVDTPGLYSRMNFGYDVLTREFRDSAACAVFVVKTDNLFLEQVFTEFNELLDLFSRIFIVVNVDSSKRDLAPDGTLRPSAESMHPEKVLEAFTTLSMDGPLRAAYEEGRVRLHAVDLLGAASSFLSGGNGGGKRAAFDTFQRDLTDYLNSTEYTHEFIGDSLRQAATLCAEVQATTGGPEIGLIRSQQERRVSHMHELDAQIAAADRLSEIDWAAALAPLVADNQRGADEAIRTKAAQVREEMRRALNAWYSDGESLASLISQQWNRILIDAGRTLGTQSATRIRELSNRAHAGLQPSDAVLADMRTLGFAPASCGTRALALLPAEDNFTSYTTAVQYSSIPVRRRFIDWVLFRSRAKVRRRLFGQDGSRPITFAEKSKRFGGATRAEFERVLGTVVEKRFPELPLRFSTMLADNYALRCAGELRVSIRALRDKLAHERAALQGPFERDVELLAAASLLENQVRSVAAEITILRNHESARESVTAPPPVPSAPPPVPPLHPRVPSEDSGYSFQFSQVTPLPML